MKFVHAADVHLDSPLRGLDAYDGAPVERLRLASRRALDNVVRLCLEEQADFLLIAGDLFDTDCRDFNAALSAAAQMRKLQQAGIPVYVILGNHDSWAEMTRSVPWPENVTVFDHKRPHTEKHSKLPVALHGMSYPKREVSQNLVPDYPNPVPNAFNIGLLHGNVGGNPNHDSYAPCSVAELVAKGYDYWALGHIHERAILHEEPHVVYAGNTQGRHSRELGAKGCLLVTVHDHTVQSLDFHETDVLRWYRTEVSLNPEDTVEAMLDRARDALRNNVEQADGRLAAVRLEFTGRCAAHRSLARDAARQQAIADLRGLAQDFGEAVWIEKIKFRTQSPLDLSAMRERQDLIGELLRDIAECRRDPSRLKELPELKALSAKVAVDLDETGTGAETLDLQDDNRLVEWLNEAEELLLSHLVE